MDKNSNPNQVVFNIREKPGIFTAVFGPRTENMYRIKNDKGYLVFTDGYEMYCKESEFEEVDRYYKKLFFNN